MKKVVIISRAFAPLNAIGAIRPTKIAKYLSVNSNCKVTVITTKKNENRNDECIAKDLKYIDKIYEVQGNNWVKQLFFKILAKIKKQSINKNGRESSIVKVRVKRENSKQQNIRTFFSYIFDFLDSCSFCKNAIKLIRTLDLNDYDLLISSYSPFASHQIAKYIKNKYPQIKWIADFRDPVFREFNTPIGFKRYCKNFARRICKKADAITAVSQGVMDALFLDHSSAKYVITNGYEKDDLIGIKRIKNEKFTMSYFGSLYNRMSDLSIIFKSIRELCDEGKVDADNIQIVYGGRQKDIFLYQISQYNLSECAVAYDFLKRKDALRIQLSSNMLLLASWNTPENTGIITGKFYEYLMLNKPIVCVVSGNLPDSTLKKMIQKAKAGICYEEAKHDEDCVLLKGYILEKYNEYVNNGEVSFCPNNIYIRQFDYKNITKKLESMIKKL